jgi:hypothetical protein
MVIHRLANFIPLNAKLNPICHLLALLGAHHLLHISRIRVKGFIDVCSSVQLAGYVILNFNPLPANVENMVSSE